MLEPQIETVSIPKLEAIGRKVFGIDFQLVKENIYSSICAEMFITRDEISFQDLEGLIYYRIKPVSICRKSTGFSIHVRTMWVNEECVTKFKEDKD